LVLFGIFITTTLGDDTTESISLVKTILVYFWLGGEVCFLGVFLYALNQCGLSLWGWSERAATNAPVQDELIEAVLQMNKNPILLARTNYFFSTFFLP
jgi:hypothetical protein